MAKKANHTNIAILKVSLKSNESVYKHLKNIRKYIFTHQKMFQNHVININDAGTDT